MTAEYSPEFENATLLFSNKVDRSKTMLAYEANYFPFWHIKGTHKIVFSYKEYLTKREVLQRCDETLSFMKQFPQHRKFTEQPFLIHWAYGNIPTKQEWDRKYSESVILVEYRISPLIADNCGRIALLTPHTSDYYQDNKQ
jgi:hypothetical protein